MLGILRNEKHSFFRYHSDDDVPVLQVHDRICRILNIDLLGFGHEHLDAVRVSSGGENAFRAIYFLVCGLLLYIDDLAVDALQLYIFGGLGETVEVLLGVILFGGLGAVLVDQRDHRTVAKAPPAVAVGGLFDNYLFYGTIWMFGYLC